MLQRLRSESTGVGGGATRRKFIQPYIISVCWPLLLMNWVAIWHVAILFFISSDSIPSILLHLFITFPQFGFCSMKWLGSSIFTPVDGLLVHHRVTPSIKFAGTYLCTWVESGTVTVQCLAQNTTYPDLSNRRRAQSWNHCASHTLF